MTTAEKANDFSHPKDHEIMDARATILVVDDDQYFRETVQEALETMDYQVATATNGVEALDMMRKQPADLVLADITMPRMNGYHLYELVRKNPQWANIPFLFLTARCMDSDILYGKELGVDDYLTKPFRLHELFAAVRGKLRRARQLVQQASQTVVTDSPSAATHTLVVGQLRMDPSQYRVWRADEEINLSAREFVLLEYLARRAGRVVVHKELLGVTHDNIKTDHIEAGSLLRPLIRSVRRKLGYPRGETGCIENVRGVGYLLTPPGD